jgi:hypothetical protein
MFKVITWASLLAQLAVGALPQLPTCCLADLPTNRAISPRGICCDACRGCSKPTESCGCSCYLERQPIANRDSSPEIEIGLPATPARLFTQAGEPGRPAAQTHSGDVPDIPVRILFCTWQK